MPTERQERNEQAATTLEERQAALASADLRAQLAAATAVILAAERDGAAPAKLREIIGGLMTAIQPRASRVLAGSLQLGWRLGRRQVVGGTSTRTGVPTLDPTLVEVVAGADARANRRLDDAAQLAVKLPLKSHEDVAAVLVAARRSVTGVETDAGWVVHRAIQVAKHQAAAETGWSLVWVAERNACLNCLAYSGRVVAPGSTFPGGLTYGDHPLKQFGALIGPPLHPNCRCQLDKTNLAPGTLDIGLAREAARSVARGLTDYASTPATFRAVDRLINGNTGLPDAALVRLPKSVLERARRNLSSGEFRFRPGSPQARAVIAERARDRARRNAQRTPGR